MGSLSVSHENSKHNPLYIVERLIEFNEWQFDRRSDEEIAVQVPGSWCDYSLFFAWSDEMEAMHFTCAFDMRVAPDHLTRAYELLALVNEKMWLGHFGVWADEGLPMFRATLPLRGKHELSLEQTEDLVETAILECERFYPAFQYVIWGGKSAREAIDAAMIDTVGEA